MTYMTPLDYLHLPIFFKTIHKYFLSTKARSRKQFINHFQCKEAAESTGNPLVRPIE